MEIDAGVASPSVLLVTDAWARGWRCHARCGKQPERLRADAANYP